MFNQKKFIVSHAPFWHDGSWISERSYHIMLAALPALILGLLQYGMPAVGVVCLSISSAILWELAFNKIAKQPETIGDGNAALIGLLFAMLLPATTPCWLVIVGTMLAVIIGKHIFGGIGNNPFNPVVLAVAMLMVSWGKYFDFDRALVNYDLQFAAVYPLTLLKHATKNVVENPELFNIPDIVASFPAVDLLKGKQVGGIGSTFGLGLIFGGVYLMIRGFIRWEISISFLAGIFLTAMLFHLSDPVRYAGPAFHLLTGYTLIGAFFLATEDSSSPVNFVPMLLYGALGGLMTVLIRNVGSYVDGVVYAILVINLVNPLLDKIRPKAIGKVV